MGFIKKTIKRFINEGLPASAILMFHHIEDNPVLCKSGCLLSFEKFKQFFEVFKDFDTLENVVKHPCRRKIAITFDDGLEDVYTVAYPFLKQKQIPFTVFIITDFIGNPGYISESQLKEMADDPLVTIGAHGVSHEILKGMSARGQEIELKNSKDMLETTIKKPVEIFAYSHGQYDSITLNCVKIYKYACSVRALSLNLFTAKQRYLLPRYNVENATFDNVVTTVRRIVKV